MSEDGAISLFDPRREFYVINGAGLTGTEPLLWIGDFYDERGYTIGRMKQRVRFESGLEVEMKPEMYGGAGKRVLDKAEKGERETRRSIRRLLEQRGRRSLLRIIRSLWDEIKPLKRWDVISVEGLDSVIAFTVTTAPNRKPPFELRDKQRSVFARTGKSGLYLCAPGTLESFYPLLPSRKPDLFAKVSRSWRGSRWRFKIVDNLQKLIAEFGPCDSWPNVFVKTASALSLLQPHGGAEGLSNIDNADALRILDLSSNRMALIGFIITLLYERSRDVDGGGIDGD